jgi:hypothetical protein
MSLVSRRLVRAAMPLVLVAVGCNEPRYPGKKRQEASAPPEAPAPSRPRDVIGKTTQDIRAAEPEIKEKGAVVASQKIVAKDPILLTGNAYVTMIGKISISQIEHAMKLYQAENNRYPRDLQEFMDAIIKPNGIRLPTLPHYQEYGYDEQEHKLVILEYPDRK